MRIDNQANLSIELLSKIDEICNSLLYYIEDLDLTNFNCIKIVDDLLLNSLSDGYFENGTIMLPKKKIQKYLNLKKYDILKSTIYHELCHLDLYNKLPILHSLYEKYNKQDNYVGSFTIMVYIEYLAHLKSTKMETIETQKDFYDSVYKLNYDFSNDIDKIYFIKAAPYIIGRDTNDKYINKIENEDFKMRIEEVKRELIKLPIKEYIDDYTILYRLEKIVSKYISNV